MDRDTQEILWARAQNNKIMQVRTGAKLIWIENDDPSDAMKRGYSILYNDEMGEASVHYCGVGGAQTGLLIYGWLKKWGYRG